MELTNEELKKHFEIANSWFIGLYMESFLKDFENLSSEDFKNNLAEELKSNEPFMSEFTICEIKEKIESLYKIICSKKVLEALNMVILFESDDAPNCYAYEEAKSLTYLIKKGNVKLPY